MKPKIYLRKCKCCKVMRVSKDPIPEGYICNLCRNPIDVIDAWEGNEFDLNNEMRDE